MDNGQAAQSSSVNLDSLWGVGLSYLFKLFYMRPFRPASSSSDQLGKNSKTILMVATAARLMARFFIVVQHLICKANVSMRG